MLIDQSPAISSVLATASSHENLKEKTTPYIESQDPIPHSLLYEITKTLDISLSPLLKSSKIHFQSPPPRPTSKYQISNSAYFHMVKDILKNPEESEVWSSTTTISPASEFKEINRQLTALVNGLFTISGVAGGVYYLSGTVSMDVGMVSFYFEFRVRED